jgi:transcriptional regulator with XRE-family HTH domain
VSVKFRKTLGGIILFDSGVTLTEIARRAGISLSMMSNVVSGKRTASKRVRKAMSRELSVDERYLFS